jgi:hypothetical protein
MTRKQSALGGDAIDALMSPQVPSSQEKPSKQNKKPNTPKDELADQSVNARKRTKTKRGRPPGAGFGVQKGTRWKRSDGEEMRARSFHLPLSLDKRLRRRAAEEDKPIGAVIVDALERLLGGA